MRAYVGGVVLNHLGWAAALGLRAGIFGKQADDEAGRFLRAAMDALGIEHQLVLDGSATSLAEIFVDDAGARAIYMAPGATAETSAEHVRAQHAGFIRRAARVTTEVSQLPLAAALATLEIARAAGIPTVVDLDVPPSEAVPGLGDAATLDAMLRSADLLKPAKRAARELAPARRRRPARDGARAARALRLRRGRRDRRRGGLRHRGAGLRGLRAGARGEGASTRPAPATPSSAGCSSRCTTASTGKPRGGSRTRAARRASRSSAPFPTIRRARARACSSSTTDRRCALAAARAAARARRRPTAALAALDVALDELAALRARLEPRPVRAALAMIRGPPRAGGRVHVTGVGKPEHVARYAASLLSSTGTPATFLHATEVVHGSAGQIVAGDVVIAISNSGETPELRPRGRSDRGAWARAWSR